jgi:hypothetical protein
MADRKITIIAAVVVSLLYATSIYFRNDLWQIANDITSPLNFFLFGFYHLILLVCIIGAVMIFHYEIKSGTRKTYSWLLPLLTIIACQIFFVELSSAKEYYYFQAYRNNLNILSRYVLNLQCSGVEMCQRQDVDLRGYDLSAFADSAFVDYDTDRSSVLGMRTRGLTYLFYFENTPNDFPNNMGGYGIDCYRELGAGWFVCRIRGT